MDFKTKLIAYCSLPILIILIATVQIYNTETTKLSRWKGGGFGMYTTINEAYHVIVVNDEVLSNVDNSRAKLNFIYNPNKKSAKDYRKHLSKTIEVEKLQIFEPIFNTETNQLVYRVRYEQVFK